MADLANSKKENEVSSSGDKTKTTQNSGNDNRTDQQKSELADKVGDAVRGDTKAAKDIYDDAKKTTGEAAGKVYDAAAKKATSKIDEQKANWAQSLSGVADSIRQIGDTLRDGEEPYGIAKVSANYTDTAADKVEEVSDYLGNKDLGEMLGDLEKFAHRNPALFLGGAFALGIAAARFLKSNNTNKALAHRPRYERKGKYLPNEHDGIHLPEDFDKQNKMSDAKTKDAANSTDKSASAASPNKGA
ncbi:MAG: hypothetical protein ABI891_08605 [Acidobacteriota bacterium]